MKKLLIFSFFVAISGFFSHQTMAQNVVKANILSPVFKTGSFFYERGISENKSFQVGVYFTGYKLGDVRLRGYGITPEFRYYLSATEAPEGVYIAPYARYQSFSLTEATSTGKGKYSSVGGGVLIGKQWIFKNLISLDTFIGPGYNAGSVKVDVGEEESLDVGSLGGFGIRTGITLGLKF
jgi:hypothetical protein